MRAARLTEDSEWQIYHGLTFEIAFGEGQVVAGEPVIPVLRDLIHHAAAAIEPLVATVA
jgi:hypothetical protein